MTDIKAKALALVNEIRAERNIGYLTAIDRQTHEALCRAIEQHEAAEQKLQDFRQEVSNELREYFSSAAFFPDFFRRFLSRLLSPLSFPIAFAAFFPDCFRRFIIPAPKPVPLEEILEQSVYGRSDQMADRVRAALDALGFEIREKSDD